MYSLQELEAMAPADTIAIAEGMGMKKANSSDIQDVIYYILDNQATATAKEVVSKAASRQSDNKTKGRKKKADATPVIKEETPSEATTETASEEPVKKKRGRKPKETSDENSQKEPSN